MKRQLLYSLLLIFSMSLSLQANSISKSGPMAVFTTDNVTNETCAEQNDGSISYTISDLATATSVIIVYSNINTNETANVTMPVTGGTATGTFSNLSPGTYQIQYLANDSQTGNSGNILIEAGGATFQFTPTLPTCNGDSDGTITVVATGGVSPYEYSLGSGRFQTVNTFSSLTAGNYSFSIRDATGCVTTEDYELTEPDALTVMLTATPPSCNSSASFGNDNGSISVQASGGTSPYEYSIDGGATFTTNATLSGLSAGNYSAIIRDANGCQITESITVDDPLAVTGSLIRTTNVNCINQNDGTVTLTASGGTGTYDVWFQNTNGGGFLRSFTSNVAITNIPDGTYDLQIRDSNGCQSASIMSGVQITEPTELESSSSISVGASFTGSTLISNLCNGSTADITLSATGGTAPYEYSVDGITYSSNPVFTGLEAGVYNAFVRDANGCMDNTDLTRTIVVADPVSFTLATTDVTCFGQNEGSITVNATSGGLGSSHTYSIDGVNFQNSNVFNNLAADTYTITVNSGNCLGTATATINTPTTVTATTNVLNDVSCFEGSNGSAEIILTGNTNPVSYSLDNGPGQSSNTFTGLTAGNHTIEATYGPDNCTISTTFSISEPTELAATSATTDPNCNGDTSGSLTLTATGGTAPYEYAIDGVNFQVSNEFSGLAAGTHNYTVRDANNCEFVGMATIAEPNPISVTYLASPPSCIGDANGKIQINLASGGTGVLRFRLQGTATFGFIIDNLSPGDYNVEMTDDNDCIVTTMVTVPEAAPLTADVTVDANASGCGNADGAFTLSNPRKGNQNIPTVEYSIDGQNYQSSPSFTGLAAGVYTVDIRDVTPANQGTGNCEGSVTATITEPSGITGNISSTDLGCNADMSGTVTISGVTGGVAPYTYSVDGTNFVNTATFSSLAAGNYDITIRDNGGCTTILSTTISEPDALSATFTTTDISCNGANDGTINLVVTGGTAPYTFTDDLTQGATPQTIPGNTATFNAEVGTRTNMAAITDANGCTFVVDFSIVEPSQLIAFVTNITDPTCSGVSDGTITLIATGGTAPYEASADGGQFFSLPSDGLISGIGATTITNISIRDANGCDITIAGFTTNDPAPITAELTTSNVTCNGATDGSIAVSPTSSTNTSFEYSLDGTSFQASSVFDQLTTGNYTVTIRETGINCTNTFTAEVTEPNLLEVAGNSVDITCNGQEDGQISGSATGGTAPYEYSLDGGNTYTTEDFIGLDIGSYNLMVRDANGCTAIKTITLTEPDELDLIISNVTDATCNGFLDGSASISVTGGVLPYSYSLDGQNFETALDLTALSVGNYALSVKDANECLITGGFTIDEPTEIVPVISTSTDVSCNGAADGQFTVSATGGSGNYTFSLNGTGTNSNSIHNFGSVVAPTTTANFNNLEPGTYTVTIQDDALCQVTITHTIAEPDLLELQFETANISCNGAEDGQIAGIASGGTAPYMYSIDGTDFQSTGFTGLSAGSYTLTAQDANECTTTTIVTIAEPDALSAQVNALTDVDCNGNSTGSAVLSVTGGSVPYSYSTDGTTFNNSIDLSMLAAGSYNISIRDANNCETTTNFNISEPDLLELSITTSTDVSCHGGSNGNITPTATGGTAPYEYSIDGTSFQSGDFTGLNTGNYTVTLRDANACTVTTTVTIAEPDLLEISLQSQEVTCNGDSDGSIIPTAIGGTAPYEYSLDGTNFQASNFNNLTAGSYTITLRDANGCTTTGTTTVTEPMALTASSTITNITCFGESSGALSLVTSGGTGPYEYALDGTNFQMSNTFDGLAADNYVVTIQDANGCTITHSAEVMQPAALTVNASVVDDNTINVTATGGTAPYEYQLNTGDFQTSASFSGLSNGDYSITVRDANGCMMMTIESLIITSVDNPLIPVAVKTYPNPADKFLTFSKLKAGDNIRLISLSGSALESALVKEDQETYQIDISDIRQKLFLVIVTNQSGRVKLHEKVMKKE